jgi:hypothetical protein
MGTWPRWSGFGSSGVVGTILAPYRVKNPCVRSRYILSTAAPVPALHSRDATPVPVRHWLAVPTLGGLLGGTGKNVMEELSPLRHHLHCHRAYLACTRSVDQQRAPTTAGGLHHRCRAGCGRRAAPCGRRAPTLQKGESPDGQRRAVFIELDSFLGNCHLCRDREDCNKGTGARV